MVQPDIVKMGGITGLSRCIALAQAHGVELVPHQTQPTIGHMASLHLAASQLHVTKPCEWNDPSSRTHAVFENPPTAGRRAVPCPAEPGLGLRLNEAELAKAARIGGKLTGSQLLRRSAMKIERIDHLNITVADIDRSIDWYQRVLGMQSERMGEARAALLFGKQKIHLDLAGRDRDERREAHAGAYLLYHRDADRRDRRAGRTVRRADPDAGPARRRDRHDPVGLYRRPGQPLDRDLDLLIRACGPGEGRDPVVQRSGR